MSNNKCPQCGLVNFGSAEACKRCGADLKEPASVPDVLLPSPSEPALYEQGAQQLLDDLQEWRLVPCPDCDHRISRSAESCPSCGRFFQRLGQHQQPQPKFNRGWWAVTIGWGVVTSGFIVLLLAICLVFVVMALGGLASLSR